MIGLWAKERKEDWGKLLWEGEALGRLSLQSCHSLNHNPPFIRFGCNESLFMQYFFAMKIYK